MRTIQVVIQDSLLKATDHAVKRLRVNRSALVREALRHHLARLTTLEKETLDRDGYRRMPQEDRDLAVWDKASAWPED